MTAPQESITLTKEQLSELMKETVNETLIKIGVEANHPLEMQKDFAHLRDVRESTEAIKRKGLLIAVGILTSACLGVAWVGIKTALQS